MSLVKYTDCEDSGVEWLGDVPRHWEVKRVKHLTSDIKAGPFGSSLTKDVYVESGYRVYGQEQVTPNDFTIGDYYIAQEKYDELSQCSVSPGDVLISCVGTFGKIAIVPDDAEPGIINPRLLRLRCNSQVEPRYLLDVLRSQITFEQFSVLSRGGTMDVINIGTLSSVMVPVPPLGEQKAISSFLDVETSKIDALVSEQRRLIELLKEKRQAVISHAVTKGLNPDVPMKDSGIQWLGDVPEHWESYRMGVLYSDSAECGNDELPVLQVSIHHGVSDRELTEGESDRKITRIEDKSKYKRVLPNDLVYNMMRAWQGGFGTVKVEGMVSPAYVVARPKRDFLTQFIEHLFRTPQAIEQMRRYSHGVTDFRLRLYWDKFKNVRVALSDKHEQKRICEHIEDITSKFDDLAAEAERAIELLQERRTALISAAVTGKIDVRKFAIEEAAA